MEVLTPRQMRDPFRQVSATPRRTSTPTRSIAMPRPSYSSNFVLSSLNSRTRYSFV